MIEKEFHLFGKNNDVVAKIHVQVENENYQKILSALDQSNYSTGLKIGSKVGKILIKIPQVRVFLPEHLIDENVKKLIQKANTGLEQIAKKYQVETMKIVETTEK